MIFFFFYLFRISPLFSKKSRLFWIKDFSKFFFRPNSLFIFSSLLSLVFSWYIILFLLLLKFVKKLFQKMAKKSPSFFFLPIMFSKVSLPLFSFKQQKEENLQKKKKIHTKIKIYKGVVMKSKIFSFSDLLFFCLFSLHTYFCFLFYFHSRTGILYCYLCKFVLLKKKKKLQQLSKWENFFFFFFLTCSKSF